MSGFLLALVLSILASTGARDQMLVAQLAGSFPRAIPVLVTGWIATLATIALAVAGGAWIAPMMPSNGKLVLLAIALGFAAFELARRQSRKPAPKEPTRSLVALWVVLVAHQLGDAVRFLLFALAVWSPFPALVAAGGAMGGASAIAIGWALGPKLQKAAWMRILRLGIAVLMAGVALIIGFPVIDL